MWYRCGAPPLCAPPRRCCTSLSQASQPRRRHEHPAVVQDHPRDGGAFTPCTPGARRQSVVASSTVRGSPGAWNPSIAHGLPNPCARSVASCAAARLRRSETASPGGRHRDPRRLGPMQSSAWAGGASARMTPLTSCAGPEGSTVDRSALARLEGMANPDGHRCVKLAASSSTRRKRFLRP